ncbi:hypothetical protein HZZ00_10970 [Streptomyces sp. NEAU-sy36]|uniref:hypothetical protein n=1 Tax=unclassified Streptomyces TaxID=2593676 RepID=UPI0015D58EBE|nr:MULTISPECIES: hypothetical protein [unclassified Streptomyces]QLJ01492.1 hypothetical protein HZZ00_10970 [Streptomyces sp. NEAU-sy36]
MNTPDPIAYGPNGYRCGCGKAAHSNLVPCQPDNQLCTAEFPGDDTFAGQLCELPEGHDGNHKHLASIAGTRHTRRLTWTDTQPTA